MKKLFIILTFLILTNFVKSQVVMFDTITKYGKDFVGMAVRFDNLYWDNINGNCIIPIYEYLDSNTCKDFDNAINLEDGKEQRLLFNYNDLITNDFEDAYKVALSDYYGIDTSAIQLNTYNTAILNDTVYVGGKAVVGMALRFKDVTWSSIDGTCFIPVYEYWGIDESVNFSNAINLSSSRPIRFNYITADVDFVTAYVTAVAQYYNISFADIVLIGNLKQ